MFAVSQWIQLSMGGLWMCVFFLALVARSSLVRGMCVVLTLSLRAVERCADAPHAGAVLMARRILFVC